MMGVRASSRESKAFGAWVLYVLAKAIDQDGTGRVDRRALRGFVDSLELQPRQWQRWISRARELGLFADVQDASGSWILVLASAARAAAAIGCEHLGNRKARMSAADLVGTGSRARVWAAFEIGFNARPISRQRMAAISGVPERTQRSRDVSAETRRQANYTKVPAPTETRPRVAHFATRTTFTTHDGQIAWRLPDVRTNDIAQRGPIGRARKANRALLQLRNDGSFHPQRPLSLSPQLQPPLRLFYRTLAATRRALINLGKYPAGVREIYELQALRVSAQGDYAWWRRCPV
jgi:hypothetical protein